MFTFADVRTDELIRCLREHPEGATLVDLAMRLKVPPPQRTLQRWLAKLIAARLVQRSGHGRTTRYFAGDGRVALPVRKRASKPPPPAVVTAPKPDPLPPSPAPVAASHLPPRFRPLFDRLAPKIIKFCYLGDVAVSLLAEGAVSEFGGDGDTMNAFVTAALDELDALERDPTLARYKLRPDVWDNWRPQWCELRGLPAE